MQCSSWKITPFFCWTPILDRYTFLFWQKTLYLHLISLTKVRPKLCEKKQKNVTPKESNIHSSWLKVALYVVRTETYMKFWKIQGVQKSTLKSFHTYIKLLTASIYFINSLPSRISVILFVIDVPLRPKIFAVPITSSHGC